MTQSLQAVVQRGLALDLTVIIAALRPGVWQVSTANGEFIETVHVEMVTVAVVRPCTASGVAV